MNTTPALDQLMGAYFHQDWHAEADDEWGVLDLFVRDEPDLAAQLPSEIDALIQSRPADDDLREYVVDELGGNFRADWDGGTYRDWLTGIADRVRAAT